MGLAAWPDWYGDMAVNNRFLINIICLHLFRYLRYDEVFLSWRKYQQQ